MKKQMSAVVLALLAGGAQAGKGDDPLLAKVMIDQAELRLTEGDDPFVIEADAWVGRDLNKLWLKADVERVDGKTEEAELQLLYSRALYTNWDLQMGWRHNARPKPDRDWLAVGFKGLAPYFFEVDAALFAGEQGRFAARLDAEYEVMLTQKLVLAPEISLNLYSKDDAQLEVGSGLSDAQAGLRLRYEIVREFAPYIGLNWNRKFGQTADYARANGEDIDDTQIVVGFRAWF